MVIVTVVYFGNSVLRSSNWDKISHYLTKEINIWNRVQLCLKKDVNQILLFDT